MVPEESVTLGKVDVAFGSGSTVVKELPVNTGDLNQGYIVRDLTFTLTSSVKDAEFRVWIDNGCIIEIDSISLHKIK